jgi:hypothetical protein
MMLGVRTVQKTCSLQSYNLVEEEQIRMANAMLVLTPQNNTWWGE